MSEAVGFSVVIPACNEAGSVGALVASARALQGDPEVIVVDDGSTDDTAAVADAAGARVVRHPENLGNGAAIKSGARVATRPIVVFLDADGQHAPADIPALLEHMDAYDMVVAARTGRRSHGSPVRAVGNAMLSVLASGVAGVRIPDLTSGFRAVRRSALLSFLGLLPNGFSYPTTLTLALLKSGRPVAYVPLDRIARRREGVSKLRPLRDGLRATLTIVRITALFSPLRVFLPVALVLVFGGLAWLGLSALRGAWRPEAVVVATGGVVAFLLGLSADRRAYLRRIAPSPGDESGRDPDHAP